MRSMIFLLQTGVVAVVSPVDLATAPPRRVDLRAVPMPCPENGPDVSINDIVVCGTRDPNERHRLRPLEPQASSPKRAEVMLPGGVKGAAEVERADIGGNVSNRLMFRLKLPF
jgi:hypothetical protein